MNEQEIAAITQELHDKVEEIKEMWQPLQAWADENGVDLSKCRMVSRLAGPFDILT
jgi:hypothetical protein